jgi:PIN domain nuclease of toxin-antitoxin system
VKLLLDTQVWLWMGLEPDRLGSNARAAIVDPQNALFLSIASAWELVLKQNSGKLELPTDAPGYVRTRLARSQTTLLEISLDHLVALTALPGHRRDPFDRMLVAQAYAESMRLVSADSRVLSYPVATMDARR